MVVAFRRTDLLFRLHNNAGTASLKETTELCSIVVGGEKNLRKKPFLVNSSEPVSPLVQGKDSLEKSLLCAEKGIPNIVYGMQMAGATAAATFAGCLAIANAEVLSQLVVMQLKNPGAPLIYGGMPSIMDMRTTIYSYGAPEKALMVAALTELWPSLQALDVWHGRLHRCSGNGLPGRRRSLTQHSYLGIDRC